MKNMNRNMIAAVSLILLSAPAIAQESMGMTEAGTGSSGLIAVGVGLVMGLAALGGTLGQSKGIAAALEGISRNPAAQPKIFVPMIIGLALIESLVIFAFLISLFVIDKM